MEGSPRQRSVLRVCWCVAAVLMASSRSSWPRRRRARASPRPSIDYLYNFLLFAGAGFCLWRAVAIREERVPWLIVGFAIVSWTAADIVWTFVYADDPNAALSEHLRRALAAPGTRPPSSRSCCSCARACATRDASLWLDGLIGAVATTALAAALAYGPVIHDGSAGDLSPAVADRPRLSGRRPAPAGA